MVDFASFDAFDILTSFRAREATPVDAFEHAVELMARLETDINAITFINPQARAEAEASARRWRDGKPIGPLDGVPITVKDNLCAAGMPVTLGSPAFRESVAETDEWPVAQVRRAGAIVLAKTNLPEFAIEGYTDNTLFGATGNPHHPSLTPGGSTGGGAASVAAGYVPIALGTDAGGSLRRPAAHCGLVALKTTLGRVPRQGSAPALFFDFEIAGGITRSLRDTRLLYQLLSGVDPACPASISMPDPEPKVGPLRILAIERFGDNPLDPEISDSFRDFLERLTLLGHHVVNGRCPTSVDEIAEVWPEIGPLHLARLFERQPEVGASVSPKYREMAACAAGLPGTRVLDILERVAQIRIDTTKLFFDWDIVVTPAIAALAWPKHESHPTFIDGRPVGPRGHAVYTGWVNAAGVPGLALPAKPAGDGRCIGVQLVAAFGNERLLLSLGDALRRSEGLL